MKLRDETTTERHDGKTPWVERESLVEATPEEVWESLTDEGRLEEWLAPDVELDPTEQSPGLRVPICPGPRDRRHARGRGLHTVDRIVHVSEDPGVQLLDAGNGHCSRCGVRG
jgi:uncharacterized protein YndB with AHSA1/START domain